MDTMTSDQHDSGDVVGYVAQPTEDMQLVEALRSGDENAFMRLVRQHHSTMMRIARLYVADDEVAEEVVQETWLEVCRGLQRFEGRSSLKTWLFRILTNIAKTRGQREARTVPFSALSGLDDESDEPSVPAERFRPTDPWQGGWLTPPHRWEDHPEQRALANESRGRITAAIETLTAQQREVITLRDIVGCTGDEVCAVLAISAANQRVLLHRARSKVRIILEQYFDPGVRLVGA